MKRRLEHKDIMGSLSKRGKVLPTSLQLTSREKKLERLLVAVADYINASQIQVEQVQLRFAGGWVRDRLLEIPSNDIDVAISAMTGVSFAQHIKEYVAVKGNLEKHNMRSHDLGSLHTIKKNPEKSKNLETATVKLLGLDVDFVNLRKETYKEDSRTPEMEFGTPQEDAMRRDASINALFYNLHSNEIEDFTGGLEDLQKGILRTPMDPVMTFKDDPLRVLRIIRFATRLEYKLDKATDEAMKREDIRTALKLKISRERVGIELEKMLRG